MVDNQDNVPSGTGESAGDKGMTDEARRILRVRDFWSALVLLTLSAFFLWQTTDIPFLGQNRAGVSGSDWYNSAAVVPFAVFGALFVLAGVLLAISVRDGGARSALKPKALGWDADEVVRTVSLAVIFTAYIIGLVPRVDFIIASALTLTALTFGYHEGTARRQLLATAMVAAPAVYAVISHLPQAEWGRWDDDIVTLASWALLTAIVLRAGRRRRVFVLLPLIAVLVPATLIMAMAFGFRQNVPNRGGLLFSQIEYIYYVHIRPSGGS